MKREARTSFNKARSLKFIAMASGNILLACKNSNLSRTQIYKWQNDDPIYRERLEKVFNGIEMFCESKLLIKAMNDDTKAMIRLLDKSLKHQKKLIIS
jgi:hypothetical protein